MSTAPTPETNERLQILQQYHHIAVVGLSAEEYKPSYGVSAYMQRETLHHNGIMGTYAMGGTRTSGHTD